jgi:hypothetical protein
MNKLRQALIYLLLVGFLHVSLPANVWADEPEQTVTEEVMTCDGPYILHQADGSADVITVDRQGKVVKKHYDKLPKNFKFKVTSYDLKHSFQVKLHEVTRPAWQLTQPEKLFVMSDPHGDLDCVITLLQGNGIIDKHYRWSFGKNRMVVIGDVFDRGNDAVQIFWLLYKLEAEAEAAGGSMSFLFGNHEPLVLMNDLRYTKPKYKLLAKELECEYPALFAPTSELGHWICTRNTMMTVGRNLFVHAGLSKEFYEQNLSIPTVNEQMPLGLYKRKKERQETSPLIYFLFGSNGPIWYRGLVRKDEKYNPIASDTLNLIMQRYEADKIIVGHTIFDDVTSFYDGRVIGVNVENAKNRKEQKGRALLITDGKYFVVGDEGVQRELK